MIVIVIDTNNNITQNKARQIQKTRFHSQKKEKEIQRKSNPLFTRFHVENFLKDVEIPRVEPESFLNHFQGAKLESLRTGGSFLIHHDFDSWLGVASLISKHGCKWIGQTMIRKNGETQIVYGKKKKN